MTADQLLEDIIHIGGSEALGRVRLLVEGRWIQGTLVSFETYRDGVLALVADEADREHIRSQMHDVRGQYFYHLRDAHDEGAGALGWFRCYRTAVAAFSVAKPPEARPPQTSYSQFTG